VLPRQPFGRTGHQSTRLIFGAAGLGAMSQPQADDVLARMLAAGINHVDTAASYGDSELLLRPMLADHRAELFLATKTGERTGDAARAELERSLERLGVDHVDLIQLHNLVEPDEWEVAFAPGAAVDALARARDEGLARFVGVTGHGVRIARTHRRSLDRFDFDSVLLPYNFTMLRDPDYRRDVVELLATCAERRVAVQTIKAVARGRWPAGSTDPHSSWYEPLPTGPAFDRAVAFVLANPQLFLNTSSDPRLLQPTVAVALAPPAAPSEAELAADSAEFDVTPLFDGDALERI
jgi:aryl-alcohol dehydrogenase-like predicted oxidoreductase